jgi:hypothetical protein
LNVAVRIERFHNVMIGLIEPVSGNCWLP